MSNERAATAALATLDRRGFLRLVGVASAAGIVPAGCAPAIPEWLVPDVPLAVLTARQYAVVTAVAARLAGTAVATAIGERRLRPAAVADTWLARTPALAAPLGQALTVLEHAVAPFTPKLRAFSRLDVVEQARVLDDFRTSRLALKRAIYAGVRSVALLGVYLAPEGRALVPYPGPFGSETVTIGDAMAPLPDA